jgi:hypothetical protein
MHCVWLLSNLLCAHWGCRRIYMLHLHLSVSGIIERVITQPVQQHYCCNCVVHKVKQAGLCCRRCSTLSSCSMASLVS